MSKETEKRAATFAEFAAKHGLEISATPVPNRPGGDSDWNARALHWHVELTRAPRTGDKPFGPRVPVWVGYWSAGRGLAENWARKGAKNPRTGRRDGAAARLAHRLRLYEAGKGGGPKHDLLEQIAQRYHATAPLDVADILESLRLDISGADQPFEDWTFETGYDPDSRRAESVWRACRDTAQQMRAGLGRAAFAEFLEIVPE